MTVADGWFLVETAGEAPAVLMIGARSKQWRHLSNEFRGSVHKTVLRLVDTVLNNVKQSQVLLDVAGPRLALASPVLGPGRQVHGVLMWIGDPTAQPPAEPPSQAWEWTLEQPPRLIASPSTDPRHPLPQSMTEWLSGFARPSDVVRMAHEMRAPQVGCHTTGEWVALDGTVHRYAHRCVATFDGPRMLGVSVTLPDTVIPENNDLLARTLTDTTAAATGLAPALLWPDGRVVAWLSSTRPDLDDDALHGRAAAPTPAHTSEMAGAAGFTVGFFPTRRPPLVD